MILEEEDGRIGDDSPEARWKKNDDYRLDWVRRDAKKLRSAELHLWQSIRDARSCGAPLRAIAEAADVSHETVRRLIGTDQT